MNSTNIDDLVEKNFKSFCDCPGMHGGPAELLASVEAFVAAWESLAYATAQPQKYRQVLAEAMSSRPDVAKMHQMFSAPVNLEEASSLGVFWGRVWASMKGLPGRGGAGTVSVEALRALTQYVDAQVNAEVTGARDQYMSRLFQLVATWCDVSGRERSALREEMRRDGMRSDGTLRDIPRVNERSASPAPNYADVLAVTRDVFVGMRVWLGESSK